MSGSPQELSSSSSAPLPDDGGLDFHKKDDIDLNDAKPTSSTDADTSTKSTQEPSDDPISSTSSDADQIRGHVTSVEEDVELEISMSQQPCGEITENVDDLVNDLETLLGESTDSFNITFKSTTRSDESVKAEIKAAAEDKGPVESTETEALYTLEAASDINEVAELIESSLPPNIESSAEVAAEKNYAEDQVEVALKTDAEVASCSASTENCDPQKDENRSDNEENATPTVTGSGASVTSEEAVVKEEEAGASEAKLDEPEVDEGPPEQETAESSYCVEPVAEDIAEKVVTENIPDKSETGVDAEQSLALEQTDEQNVEGVAVEQTTADGGLDESQAEVEDKSSTDLGAGPHIECLESLEAARDGDLEQTENIVTPSDDAENATNVTESVDQVVGESEDVEVSDPKEPADPDDDEATRLVAEQTSSVATIEEDPSELVNAAVEDEDFVAEALPQDPGDSKHEENIEEISPNKERLDSTEKVEETTAEREDVEFCVSQQEITEEIPEEEAFADDAHQGVNEPDKLVQSVDDVASDKQISADAVIESSDAGPVDAVAEVSNVENVPLCVEEIAVETSDEGQNEIIVTPVDQDQDKAEIVETAGENVVENAAGSLESEVSLNQELIADPEANLETIMAVANLQNDPIVEIQAKTLSEREIQEMETLRLAVDSITDARDSYHDEIIMQNRIVGDRISNEHSLNEPLTIRIEESEKKVNTYSPKITIKPIRVPDEEVTTTSESELNKGSLRMTITKQSDTLCSILKPCDGQDDVAEADVNEAPIPKLIIKSKMQVVDRQHSPKIAGQGDASPLKITIKGLKGEGEAKPQSPRITIKPIPKPSESEASVPKVTIRPVKRQDEPGEDERSSPKITIKPVVRPNDTDFPRTASPKLTIKPLKKPDADASRGVKRHEEFDDDERSSPKVVKAEHSDQRTQDDPVIKPVVAEVESDEDAAKGRIVLKINKGNIPGQPKEAKKREFCGDDDKSEKLAKIKLKFSKEGGHPHIVQDENNKRLKRDHEYAAKDPENSVNKRHSDASYASKISELTAKQFHVEVPPTIVNVATVATPAPKKRGRPRKVPLQPREEFSPMPSASTSLVSVDSSEPSQSESETPPTGGRPKRSCRGQNVMATLGIKPRKPRGRGRGSKVNMGDRLPAKLDTPEHTPKARGRPRLVPKVEEAPVEVVVSAEPMIAIEDSKNEPVPFLGERNVKNESDTSIKREPDPGISEEETSALQRQKAEKRMKQLAQLRTKMAEKRLKAAEIKKKRVESAKLKRMSRLQAKENDDKARKQLFINRAFNPSFAMHAAKPPEEAEPEQLEVGVAANQSILVVDEETRMSADRDSRGATPAKNVAASETVAEESQSSMHSTGTTESGSGKTGGSSSKPGKPRLEVHQETDAASITVDQLAEYSWNGDGPFMLQEQVAQFLGIKSFKRKYPNIPRRPVDMQERDFIREAGMATEALCDMGLTAVSGQDILDIMYADFQDKYEEYCRCQREKQARELANKQKALSQQAKGHERRDIMEQAVQSAAQWNQQFNRDRRDHRKASMDLQSLAVHYPKERLKKLDKDKVGDFPVALVPGQFTDFYEEFTPTELNNLPLNTMCYDEVRGGSVEASEDSGSSSDSDSSTSSSTSSDYSSDEDCNLCATKAHVKKPIVTKASG
ncbi:uncharacterized protein LOC132707076 [Cylas formicarius]|uniref:uncharacterized protein LOC132707076 n=1 Tax=Cylas formicarius TaxID=197179 RepID=UPI002958CB39|nr:uncharacterized protein LOC132707076 [Cylas formicarius]